MRWKEDNTRWKEDDMRWKEDGHASPKANNTHPSKQLSEGESEE